MVRTSPISLISPHVGTNVTSLTNPSAVTTEEKMEVSPTEDELEKERLVARAEQVQSLLLLCIVCLTVVCVSTAAV